MNIPFPRSIVASTCTAVLLLAAVHCGPAIPEVRVAPPPEALVPRDHLLELAVGEIYTLVRPDQPIGELRSAIRGASGHARRVAMYRASLHFMFTGDNAEEAGARRVNHRAAIEMAQRGLRGNEDATLGRSLDFVVLWCSWQRSRQSVRNLVRRFLEDHGDDNPLARIVWAIHGEYEADNERWDEALGAWRNLIGDARDPLHAYSLLRTGQVHRSAGNERHSNRALRQVRGYGCHDDAPPEVLRFANLAAVELGEQLQFGPNDQAMPPICLANGDED